MEWLEPWCSVSQSEERFKESWNKQLQIELSPGHVLFGVPVKLIARGNGDDALFEFLDGSGRAADVHLTWKKGPEKSPLPGTAIYASLEHWAQEVMIPENQEWES